MDAKAYVLKKYNIKTDVIEIPDVDRKDLAQLFHDLDFKIGVEVGVAAGEFSRIIMDRNPQLTSMTGVDPHEPYSGYKDYVRVSTFNQLLEDAHKRLDEFPQYHFSRKYSVDAAADFEDGSLDFVYIDANHQEEPVYADITAWAPKVRAGGIVSGHDYARLKGNGIDPSDNWAVIPALHRYVDENNLELFIWGLEAKLANLKRDPSRSWMFIK